jgi:putative iron-regulated protein
MKKTVLLFLLLFWLIACGGRDDTALKQSAVETYADIAYATYADSYSAAVDLQAALETFIATPSDAALADAKAAWLAAREPYGQTEAFRFAGGPIDDADGPEGLINAWPLDEAYIDYVQGAAESGIINNVADYPTIDRDLLIRLNENGAETNISVGYHAIEFLLWGQDLSADSAGNRPVSDYTTAPNAERRAAYLQTTAALLVENLGDMVREWQPDASDNFRAEWLALDADQALRHAFTGIGVLSKGELAGQRIFVAYDNQDQEEEHSCFSDNTHRDIVTNAQGVRNIYTGSYTRTDGTVVRGVGLDALVESADSELNTEILALLDTTMTRVNTIEAPFDQAIVQPEKRPAVLAAVNALQDQGDKFAEAAAAVGLTINPGLSE